ncbi:LADA_0D01332g1_1 [Lachancea dasiensis]|uniref:LADA_0D01332g1_1 n=1 Tax=Lachancea dasiensis TaxID=1072105 RepID=A0A1G4J3V4_9SACH|nr:LADA_0D01332g1_1 [Lachancea dasiensis]
MQGSIYSSPFPAINPRVRYRTALERAGFDVNFDKDGKAGKYRQPLQSGRHVSEGGRAESGKNWGGISAHQLGNNSQRSVSGHVYKAPNGSSEHPTLIHEPLSSPNSSAEHTPQAHAQWDHRMGVSQAQTQGEGRSDSHPKSASGSSLVSKGGARLSVPSGSNLFVNRVSSGFDFENKVSAVPAPERTSAADFDPVEKSFLQLTQNSNESFSSQAEREVSPYLGGSHASTNMSNDNFEDAQSQYESPEKAGNAEKWNSFMRLSGGPDVLGLQTQQADLPRSERSDLGAGPNSSRISNSSISFSPVAELHVNFSPRKQPEHPTSVPRISVSSKAPNVSDSSADRKSWGVDSRRSAVSVAGYEEGQVKLESSDIDGDIPDAVPFDSSSVKGLDNSLHLQEETFRELPDRPELTMTSGTQEKVGEHKPQEQGEEEEEEEEEEFDPSSTLTSSHQVERLLAQLNDVSLNRNLTVGKRDPFTPSDGRFKKSSAYLSGFIPPDTQRHEALPEVVSDMHFQSQTLQVKDEDRAGRAGELSPDSDSTPRFYKFRENVNPEASDDQRFTPEPQSSDILDATKPSNRLLDALRSPVIEPLQMHRISSPTSGDPKPVSDTPTGDSHDHQPSNALAHALEFQHPPGQGPCRACGLAVTSKSIYSKKDNELSGQWHRPCFKCIKCDLKFSKHTPCYILNDQPYCQLHYHITNNSICGICQGFIEGECLENDRQERYHLRCLTCFRCGDYIREDYYLFNNDLPLCHNHDTEELKKEVVDKLGRSTTISKRRTRLLNFN